MVNGTFAPSTVISLCFQDDSLHIARVQLLYLSTEGSGRQFFIIYPKTVSSALTVFLG